MVFYQKQLFERSNMGFSSLLRTGELFKILVLPTKTDHGVRVFVVHGSHSITPEGRRVELSEPRYI